MRFFLFWCNFTGRESSTMWHCDTNNTVLYWWKTEKEADRVRPCHTAGGGGIINNKCDNSQRWLFEIAINFSTYVNIYNRSFYLYVFISYDTIQQREIKYVRNMFKCSSVLVAVVRAWIRKGWAGIFVNHDDYVRTLSARYLLSIFPWLCAMSCDEW